MADREQQDLDRKGKRYKGTRRRQNRIRPPQEQQETQDQDAASDPDLGEDTKAQQSKKQSKGKAKHSWKKYRQKTKKKKILFQKQGEGRQKKNQAHIKRLANYKTLPILFGFCFKQFTTDQGISDPNTWNPPQEYVLESTNEQGLQIAFEVENVPRHLMGPVTRTKFATNLCSVFEAAIEVRERGRQAEVAGLGDVGNELEVENEDGAGEEELGTMF